MAAPPRRNLLPRFSLRALMLALVLLTLFASHLVTSYRLWRAEGEVRRLRDQLGELVVSDPTRIHVLPVELQEPKAWRWRLYLPPSRNYELHEAMSDIPPQGVVRGGHSVFRPGEYTVTARIQRDEHARWSLMLFYDQGSASMPFPAEQTDWLERREGGFQTEGVIGTVHGRGTQVFAPNDAVVLLRVRASTKVPGGGWSAPAGPTQGVLLWIRPTKD